MAPLLDRECGFCGSIIEQKETYCAECGQDIEDKE
jgi:predicted nucleic acid-binding Zn ribbon protein